jgi:hypothetical protein
LSSQPKFTRPGAALSSARRSPFLLALLVLALSPAARADDEDLIATRPAPVPSTAPAELAPPPPAPMPDLRARLKDLSDPDGAVRDRARQELMAMPASALDAFKQLVADVRPLAPDQRAALKDIVTHVYLSGRTYPSTNRSGFLGVSFDDFQIVRDADEDGPRYGVVVTGRLPGFVGYRVLQDGDVITHVERQPFASRGDFSQAIQASKAGSPVHLDLIRQGRTLQVELRLDLRPTWAEALNTIQPGSQARQEEADDYWTRNFEPLTAARAD